MSNDDRYREGFIDAITKIAEMIQRKAHNEMFTKHYFAQELLKEMDKIRRGDSDE